MSNYMSELWETEPAAPQWIVATKGSPSVVLCVTSHGDDEAKARRIVSDHNACIGIEDPATTVPELVEACTQSDEAMTKAFQELLHSNTASYLLLSRALTAIRNVLAKTGKQNDPPPPERKDGER